MKKHLIWMLLLTLASLACTISVDLFNPPPLATPIVIAAASPTPKILQPSATPLIVELPTATPVPPTPVVDTPALTAGQIRNARLDILGSDQLIYTVQFQDGAYREGTDASQPGFLQMTLGQIIVIGDVNGDGAQDAVTTVAEHHGGTGVFVSLLVVLNQGGLPGPTITAYIDDRPIINSLALQGGGEIVLNATVHGINDPMCCPSQPTVRTYRLVDGNLIAKSISTTTPAGTDRRITIETPASGVAVEKIFTITGSFTIAPFENTFNYAVYIPDMQDPFTQGPLTVNVTDPGAPGNFELPLNFTAAGYSGPVRIVISDLSAADGSILAQDTLFVSVK